HGDDRPGGRPLRPRAASPAPGAGRTRCGAVVLPVGLATEGGADRAGGAPAGGAGRDNGRLRAGGGRPRAPRRGAAARYAAVGSFGPPLHEAPRRPPAPGEGAGGGARAGRHRGPARRRAREAVPGRGPRCLGCRGGDGVDVAAEQDAVVGELLLAERPVVVVE